MELANIGLENGNRDSTEEGIPRSTFMICMRNVIIKGIVMQTRTDGENNVAFAITSGLKYYRKKELRMKRILCVLLVLTMSIPLCACTTGGSNYSDPAADIRDAKKGEYITFGEYEQDNNTTNGPEEIEWLVLKRTGNKILVISKYCLDNQTYLGAAMKGTWDTSILRQWLNDDFVNSAFSTNEQGIILQSYVPLDTEYHTDSGKETYDKIFLLSMSEAFEYFPSESSRKCKATAYAKAQGAQTDTYNYCLWWLRTRDRNSLGGEYVDNAGNIYHWGGGTETGCEAVRPVMWINVE